MAPEAHTEELMVGILEMRRHNLVSTDLVVVEDSKSDNTLLCNTPEMTRNKHSSTRKGRTEEKMSLYKVPRQYVY